jgi:PAS domain S-box-containing protein
MQRIPIRIREIVRQQYFIVLIFCISLVIIAVIGYFSYRHVYTWRLNNEEVARSRELLLSYESLQSAMGQAESAQRGYLITGDSLFLGNYRTNVNQVTNALTSMESLARPASLVRLRFPVIDSLARVRIGILEGHILLYNQVGIEAVAEDIRRNAYPGKQIMDLIREELIVLGRAENEILNYRQTSSVRSGLQAANTYAAGSIISVLLLVWAFWLVWRQLKFRRVALETLENANRMLEKRVKERTRELHSTVQELSLINEQLTSTNQTLNSTNEQLNNLNGQLRESEERFRSMADNAPVLIWMAGADGLHYFFNETWLDFRGRTPDQEYGFGWTEGIHPDDADRFREVYLAAFDARQPFRVEYRLRHYSGNYRYLLDAGVPRFTGDGTFVGYIGSCIDINDRKTAEDKLFKNEKLLQSILQNMGEGVIVADKSGHILMINPEATRILGGGKNDTPAEQWMQEYNLYLPDQVTPYPANNVPLRRAIRGEFIEGAEFYVKHALTGEGKTLLCNARPLLDADGALQGGVLVIRDITERKKAEKILKDNETLLQQIFDESVDAMLLIDPANSQIVRYNQQAMQLFGYRSHEEIIGMPGDNLQKHPFTEEESREIIAEVQARRHWTKDIEYISRTGREFWGNVAITLIETNEKQYFMIRVRDITERLASQKELEKALAIIQEDNTRKTRELEEARIMQLSMLPQSPPQLPFIDMAMFMKTSTEVGGDYYDYKVAEDGTLTLVVGDATGHGLKAGIVVATVKSYFHTLANQCNPVELLERISEGIQNMQIRAMYMGLTCIRIKHDQLEIASAGMPPVYIYQAQSKRVIRIQSKGLFLGSNLPSPFQYNRLPFQPGDTLLLMTDGFPELFNKDREILDYERIEQRFSEAAQADAQEIIDRLNALADGWVNGAANEDDITMVTLKYKEEANR